ncbi:MAG: hypothetical protein RL172_172 [Bacteroidota bacterium]|jgi:tetratricopeptide (TPR) repeat protein
MSDSFQFTERAALLLEQGRITDAIKQLTQALELAPENDHALALYARCQYEQKKFTEGIETIQRALAINPDSEYYFYLQGFGFYRTDNNVAAIASLEQSISINPYFAESFGLLGYVYLDDKNFKQALDKANEGLQADPENITCLNVRSIAQNKLKMTDAAIETMEYALAQDPDNEFTHTTVGWNYLEKGKHNLAANHFREALRIDPNMPGAKEGLKEALKSKIPPYKWLLQYSFWINNKGKKAGWMIPLGIYFAMRLLTGALGSNNATKNIVPIVVGLYLLFVITSWLINPIANLFLLFYKDGKYALTTTEKNTAITVVSALVLGLLLLTTGMFMAGYSKNLQTAFMIAGIALAATAVPLGKIEYPLSFNSYGKANKFAMILAALGLVTCILAFAYLPAAIVTGGIFMVLFVLNNWLSIFR